MIKSIVTALILCLNFKFSASDADDFRFGLHNAVAIIENLKFIPSQFQLVIKTDFILVRLKFKINIIYFLFYYYMWQNGHSVT